jgi:pilus assembly protein Flp/PilA
LEKESEMLGLLNRFRRDERGATATEYAMLVVFIALAVAVGATALGGGINSLFTKVGDELTAVTPPTLPPTTP